MQSIYHLQLKSCYDRLILWIVIFLCSCLLVAWWWASRWCGEISSTTVTWRRREVQLTVFLMNPLETWTSCIAVVSMCVLWSSGAVVLRLARSWFRIGSLEVLTRSGELDLLRSGGCELAVKVKGPQCSYVSWNNCLFLFTFHRKLLHFIIENHFPAISTEDPDKYLVRSTFGFIK